MWEGVPLLWGRSWVLLAAGLGALGESVTGGGGLAFGSGEAEVGIGTRGAVSDVTDEVNCGVVLVLQLGELFGCEDIPVLGEDLFSTFALGLSLLRTLPPPTPTRPHLLPLRLLLGRLLPTPTPSPLPLLPPIPTPLHVLMIQVYLRNILASLGSRRVVGRIGRGLEVKRHCFELVEEERRRGLGWTEWGGRYGWWDWVRRWWRRGRECLLRPRNSPD